MSESTIGGFELIEKIGEGGMGSVIKARQISLDRIVALKMLPPRLVSTQDDIDQFIREARAAAKLQHPGLAQIYEAGESDGVYYFAMEFIDGKDLHQILCEQGGFAEKEALTIVECIAAALDHAWSNEGIIHRDVKPSNILVDKAGNVKLIDLGIVKIPGETSDATVKGDMLGTPHYCSPEQAEGQKLDCRSDIYGLGATLYHMVTGERPFGDAEGAGAMVQQVTGHLPDPRNINPALSAKIVKLISIMMAKQPADRYTDWKEVIKDIKRVGKGKYPLRQPQAGFASTVKVNASTAGKKVSDRNARRTSNVKRTQRPSREKSSPLPIIIPLVILSIVGLIALLTVSGKNKRLVEAEKLDMWAATQLEKVEQYHTTNPNEYDKAAVAFRKLATNPNLPQKYQIAAKDRAAAMKVRKKQAIEKAVKTVEASVAKLLTHNDFTNALAICKKNDGPFATHTQPTRKKLEREIATRKKKKEATEKAIADKIEAARLKKEKAEKARLAAIEKKRQNTPPEFLALTEKYNEAMKRKIGTPAEAPLKAQYIQMLTNLQRKLMLDKKVEQALVVKEKKDIISALFKAKEEMVATLKQSLVLAYDFNKYTEGAVKDVSSGNNHAKTKNVAWTSDGYSGGAYSFNGSDSQMTGPDWSALKIDNEITVELCIRFLDRGAMRNRGELMSVGSANDRSFGIRLEGNRIHVCFGGNNFRFDAVPLKHDTWHNIILVAKDDTAVVYLDGIANSPQHPGINPNWPPTGPLEIGTFYKRSQRNNPKFSKVVFKGLMDEVRIYNKALTAKMVKQLYATHKK